MIVNRFIPFGRFTAINLFGLIFVRSGKAFTDTDLHHEHIHTRQLLEMLVLPFYIWYVMEWFLRLLKTHNLIRAYRAISFEREAYDHQDDEDYLQRRRPYAWLKYLFQNGAGTSK